MESGKVGSYQLCCSKFIHMTCSYSSTTQLQLSTSISDWCSLGNDNLRYVDKFRHIGPVLTSDFKDVKKEFKRKHAVENMLIRKFSCAPNYACNFFIVQVVLLPNIWVCTVV